MTSYILMKSKNMSGRRGGRGGSRAAATGFKTVSISRDKGSSTYAVRDKATRSMSELSSLTDVSTADLAGMDVMLESSVLKVIINEKYSYKLNH